MLKPVMNTVYAYSIYFNHGDRQRNFCAIKICNGRLCVRQALYAACFDFAGRLVNNKRGTVACACAST